MKKQNVLTKEEVTKTFDNVEAKLSSPHFTFLLSSRSIVEPGLCVILAKKNIKKATKRNLCRRMIKESFRAHKDFLANKSLVVLIKKPAGEATKEDLWQSIRKFQQFLES